MNKPQRKSKNWLEWTVFGAGLALVIAIFAYLTYHAVTSPSGPPQIVVELGPPQTQGEHFAVPVAVTNQGYETAEQVEILVTLTTTSDESEAARFEVQFLPRGATRQGTVTFETNPVEARALTTRVLGYRRP